MDEAGLPYPQLIEVQMLVYQAYAELELDSIKQDVDEQPFLKYPKLQVSHSPPFF